MWPRLINAGLGVWLMAAPAVLGYSGPARTNDLIVGPVAASMAIIALWEATRPLRRVNLALGLWLVLAPWVLGYGSALTVVNDVLVGLLLAGLSLVRGEVRQRFGGGWSALWQPGASGPGRRAAPR